MRMRTVAAILFTIGTLAADGNSGARPRDVPSGYTETILASGLNRPVALAFLPDGRLLIGEQHTGVIRMYKNGALLSTPYSTESPVYIDNEAGLLGLCVDPNFATNGYVYAFVTSSSSAQRIRRYTTVGDTATTVTTLVDNIPTWGGNHNGGGIGFGPDGMLYVAVGDNGFYDDAQVNASWRGKILRFTAAGAAAPGNVLGGAVYSKGHRHPFRFAWQAGTNKMFCTENGPSDHDEINVIVNGGNYGWPNYSGPDLQSGYGPISQINPITSFTPAIAPTGILFYTGTSMPFNGQIFYVDYKNNRIRRMTLGGASGEQIIAGPSDFVTLMNEPVDIAQGPGGMLYYSGLDGTLRRAQASGGNLAPTSSFTRTPPTGPPPLTVSVNATSSIDQDGSIVSYAWNWGDGTPIGTGVIASHPYPSTGTYTIQLTVTDNLGATGTSSQDVVCITRGNTPPSAHIQSALPTSGVAPLTVALVGHGHDTAGPLEYRWSFGDGSPYVFFAGMTPDANSMLSYIYTTPGTYTLTLRVRDPENITGTHSLVITVTATPGGGGGGGWRRGRMRPSRRRSSAVVRDVSA